MFENELKKAEGIINELLAEYFDDTGRYPSKLYVADGHELQSMIMYAASIKGLKYERTNKDRTYFI